MKHFLTIIFLLIFIQAKSQAPNWAWARGAQSNPSPSDGGEGYTVASDTKGNVYVGGWFFNSTFFGPYQFNSPSGVFIAKYDSLGTLLWAKCGTSVSSSIGSCITTDLSGNSYLTGWFSGSLLFGTDTLTSNGIDIFLVKYDPFGNLIWAKNLGGTGNELSFGIASDNTSNIYLTGSLSSQFIFANDTLSATGGGGTFLIKYDSLGTQLWGRSLSSSGYTRSYTVATGIANNVYIGGEFSGEIIFNTDTIVSSGYLDTFLAKYDSFGNPVWIKCAGVEVASLTDQATVNFIATDNLENIYMTGTFKSYSLSFDSDTLLNPSGDPSIYLVKYDSSGNALWVRGIQGDQFYGSCVATNRTDKVYVSGGSNFPFGSPLIFDTLTTYYPIGASDPMFIAGYDSAGNILFAKVLESGGDDQNAIAVDPSGSIYIGGDFAYVNPFIVGNDSLILTGEENVFVAKLSYHSSVGVSEINENQELLLYPNPFNNKISISIKENGSTEIILYDILSRKLLEQTFLNSTTINTEQLANGIYIYELRNKNGIFAKGKVIKQ